MIGVLPVLPAVEALGRLRHWTHRAVGIPLTIYRHSEAMREASCADSAACRPGQWPSYDRDIPPWVEDVGDGFSIGYAFQATADLDSSRRLDR